MMRHLMLLLFGLVSLTTTAQHVRFTLGGGLATHTGSAKALAAFKVGVGYEIEFNQRFTFTPTFCVYGKGWKDPNARVLAYDDAGNQLFDEDTGEPLTGVMSKSASANYLEVPLLFSYYWRQGESRYVVFSAGPYVAYGVTGKQTIKGDTEHQGAERYFYQKKTFDEAGTHRFDAGVQAFVGYQLPKGITFGVEADFGLMPFDSDGHRNLSGLITLGYTL